MADIAALAGRRFGPVTIIPGARSSVFPNCTSLLVDGGSERALIDPGAGEEALSVALGPSAAGAATTPAVAGRVTCVINTHYHFDHISGNHLFPGVPVFLNEVERECFPNLEEIGSRLGIRQVYGDSGVADWIREVAAAANVTSDLGRPPPGGPRASHDGHGPDPRAPFSPAYRPEWWFSTRIPARAYPYGEFAVGSVRMVMVPSPGHTAGFCCPFFPDEGLVYTGDVDLTTFGPWYAGADGDIDAFIRSARALLDLDAEWFLTGHQEGLLRRAEFAERLEDYLAVIDRRDRLVLELLDQGVRKAEPAVSGIVYPSRYHSDPWIRMWDVVATAKHVERVRRIVGAGGRNGGGRARIRPCRNMGRNGERHPP